MMRTFEDLQKYLDTKIRYGCYNKTPFHVANCIVETIEFYFDCFSSLPRDTYLDLSELSYALYSSYDTGCRDKKGNLMGRGHKIGEGGKDIEFAWWLFLSFSDTDRIGIDLKVILKETEPLLVILWSASEEQKNLLLGTNLVAFVE